MWILLLFAACRTLESPQVEVESPATCTAANAVVEGPRICLTVPDGFVPDEVSRNEAMSSLAFRNEAEPAHLIVLQWVPDQGDAFYAQQLKATQHGALRDANAQSGQTANGGWWARYRLLAKVRGVVQKDAIVQHSVAIGRASSGEVVYCRSSGQPDEVEPMRFLEACSTMEVP